MASPPAVLASAHSSVANGTSFTLTLPSAPATGDLLVVALNISQFQAVRAVTVPSGWTQLDDVTNTNVRLTVLYRLAAAASPAAFAFSFSGTAQTHSGGLVRVGGASSIVDHAIAAAASTSLAATNDDDLPLAFFVQDNGSNSGVSSPALATAGWNTDCIEVPSFHATVGGHGPATVAGGSVAPTISWGGSVQYPASSVVVAHGVGYPPARPRVFRPNRPAVQRAAVV